MPPPSGDRPQQDVEGLIPLDIGVAKHGDGEGLNLAGSPRERERATPGNVVVARRGVPSWVPQATDSPPCTGLLSVTE
jgi:hypothetical protein